MFTESFLIGYQPQDLVMRPAFWAEAMEVCEALAMATYMGGGPSYAYSAKALRAFDTFSGKE